MKQKTYKIFIYNEKKKKISTDYPSLSWLGIDIHVRKPLDSRIIVEL